MTVHRFSALALALMIPLALTPVATAAPNEGTVSLVRVVRGDATAAPVAGVPLNIYSGSDTTGAPVKRVVSTSKPLAITLPQGTYTILEPGAQKYTAQENRAKIPLKFTVSPTTPATIVYSGPPVLTVNAQSTNGSQVKSGGSYKVATCAGSPVATLTPTGSTESASTQIPNGCIKVTATAAPKGMGFTQKEATTNASSSGATTVLFTFTGSPAAGPSQSASQGSTPITLKTLIRGSDDPLPRATYNFMDCSTGNTKARVTTGDNGSTTFTLPKGCYRLRQHAPVSGYDMDQTEQEIMVDAQHIVITATNRRTGDTQQPVSDVPVVGTTDAAGNVTAKVIGGTQKGEVSVGSGQVTSIPAGVLPARSTKCVVPQDF